MRSLSIIAVLFMTLVSSAACGGKDDLTPEQVPEQPEEKPVEKPTESTMTINIIFGGKTFSATIEDSATGRAFFSKLPLTLQMSELNGNEKYCYGVSLPSADKRFDSIVAGDLMLYSGNCVVLFYGNAGGYNYTRIGKLTNTTGLKEAVGNGSVTITFAKR